VRTIKTTAISMLTAGLLAGSAIGVVAQDEEESATYQPYRRETPAASAANDH